MRGTSSLFADYLTIAGMLGEMNESVKVAKVFWVNGRRGIMRRNKSCGEEGSEATMLVNDWEQKRK